MSITRRRPISREVVERISKGETSVKADKNAQLERSALRSTAALIRERGRDGARRGGMLNVGRRDVDCC